MITLSLQSIYDIYQRHISKDIPKSEARGHCAGLLCLHGHFDNPTLARRYVRALFA